MTRPRTLRLLAIGSTLVLSSFVTAVTQPAHAVTTVTRMAFEGEIGDRLQPGRFVEVAGPITYAGARLESGIDELYVSAGTQFNDVLFRSNRDDERVTVGLFEGAIRADAPKPRVNNKPIDIPGLYYFGGGLGCYTLSGRYRVDEVARDVNGKLTAFAARFEQHCNAPDGKPVDAASFGVVAYNASVPIYEHQLSAMSLAFPTATTVGSTSATQNITITNRSTVALPVASITLTGASANQFTIVNDPCSSTSIALGGTCTVGVAYKPTVAVTTVAAKLTIADAFTAWGVTAPMGEDVALTVGAAAGGGGGTGGGGGGGTGGGGVGGVISAPPTGGEFHPLPPARILDTRNGTGLAGGTARPLGNAEELNVAVAGHGGVPATGASAVVVNLTATDSKQSGWLALFPSGTTWPGSSSVNFPTGGTAPNMAVTALGADGAMTLRNCCGTTDAVIDVVGWYGSATDAPALGYNALPPTRLLDTRKTQEPIGADSSRRVVIIGSAGVPANASAVVVNVTATEPTAATYLTLYPGDQTRPSASSLNVVSGETRPNLVTVKLDSSGAIGIYNHAGSVQVILDVVGYYGPSRVSSGRVAGSTPVRLLDTRTITNGQVGPGGVTTIDLHGTDGQVHIEAVILNVTVTEPTAASYVTVYPSGLTVPDASSLNVVAGQTIANLVMVPVGTDGKVAFFNHVGSVQLVVDLVGVVTQ